MFSPLAACSFSFPPSKKEYLAGEGGKTEGMRHGTAVGYRGRSRLFIRLLVAVFLYRQGKLLGPTWRKTTYRRGKAHLTCIA